MLPWLVSSSGLQLIFLPLPLRLQVCTTRPKVSICGLRHLCFPLCFASIHTTIRVQVSKRVVKVLVRVGVKRKVNSETIRSHKKKKKFNGVTIAESSERLKKKLSCFWGPWWVLLEKEFYD